MTETSATVTSPDDILHETRITPMQWLILALGVIGSMVEGFDIVIIAYTAPAISADWGVSSEALGIVLSAGVFGMTLGAMFLSWLADRYGRRIVVSATLMIAGIATAAILFAETVTHLVILRIIAGLALGVLVATLPALVGEFSPVRHRTLIVSVLIAAGSAGAVLGGFISAAVIADYGWKSIYLYGGLLTIVLGVLMQLLVPESIAFVVKRRPAGALQRVNRTLTYIGQRTIEALPSVKSTDVQEAASVGSLLTPARRLTTIASWTAFFSGFLVVYFISSWMPQILANAGLEQKQAIQATAIIPLGSILGTMLIGWLGRWWPLSRLVAIGFVVSGVGILVLSTLLDTLAVIPFASLCLILFALGVALMGPFSNLYTIALTVYPAQIRSTGLGWSAGLGRAGAVISPAVAGLLLGLGVSMPVLFVIFAVPALLAALCVSFIRMVEMR